MQGIIDRTYSPTVDSTTTRSVLSMGIEKNLVIHQRDVRTAFLHGKIDSAAYKMPANGSVIYLGHQRSYKAAQGPFRSQGSSATMV